MIQSVRKEKTKENKRGGMVLVVLMRWDLVERKIGFIWGTGKLGMEIK